MEQPESMGRFCIICVFLTIIPINFLWSFFSQIISFFGMILWVPLAIGIYYGFRNMDSKSEMISRVILVISLFLVFPLALWFSFLALFPFQLLTNFIIHFSLYFLIATIYYAYRGNAKLTRRLGVLVPVIILLGSILGPILSDISYYYRNPLALWYIGEHIIFSFRWSGAFPLWLWLIYIILIALYVYPSDVLERRKGATRRRRPAQKPPRKPKRWVPSKRQVTVAVCGKCGRWNNPVRKGCWNCRESLADAPHHTETFDTDRHCIVCSGELKSRDRIVLCPECRTQAHRAHLLEYVRVHTCCPDCGQPLRSSQLLPTA